ncbi:hypothetical protein C4J81_05065 [Deltaproteobacteria bacterium Smac51]|nr:hypothetical protein C4J81_05065 [Deltaproteobacteria bacterium Smac51]
MNRLALAFMIALFAAGCGNDQAAETNVPAETPEAQETTVNDQTPEPPVQAQTPAPAEETPAPAAAAEEVVPTGLAAELAHHNFVIKSFDGQEFSLTAPDGTKMPKPNMSFGQWPHVNGKICNGYNAQASLEGSVLKFEKGASTLMMCFDENLNKLESTLHLMMSEGAEVTIENGLLTLKGNGHVLEFELSDYVS